HRTYSLENGTLEESMVRRDPVLCRALEISVLCNNAMEVESNGQKSMSGDPTEIALLQSVSSCYSEFGKLRHKNKSIAEIPFDSARKMMSAIRFYGKGRMAFVKGAPERLLPKCSKCLSEKGESQLDAAERSEFLNKARGMGAEGMRVLALAYRPVKKQNSYSPQNTERDLVFVGFVGMDDPPRKEVASAIALCKTAGIRVMMVTGDSLPTAKAIAARVGLLEHGQIAIEGSEIEEMDDSELERILPNVCIFARTTPEQKYRITSALMRMGEVVAVTGDGVNDAPALKKANIGVAMGLSGNDVSKGVADIVLTDDNFTSIVHAVRYGRAIFSNIKAFVRYQISTNVAALSLMFTAPMLSFPLPLLPLQLLWINIIVDGPPALALGVEPPSHDEMDQPPRNPKTPLLSRNFSAAIIFTGLLMAALSLAVFAHYCAVAPEKAGTAVFTLFVFMQLANALNCRFARRSAFARLFANPWLLLALVASVAIQLVIIFNPSLQPVFRTVPLSEWDFGLILVATSILLIVEEARKKFLPSTTVY
ncbi:MAG: cation-transporting P-type ATPase, partial [Candidatus Micrarchaeota archaeon]|nr:cation-transporting P-type ATPase [Candidatus Micrarchaeota archaeon]